MQALSAADSSASGPTVLYVSSPDEERCGVYQFGRNVAAALTKARRYHFVAVECSDCGDLFSKIRELDPAAVIYNYHPSTMRWVDTSVTKQVAVPQIGTVHECPQRVVDRLTNELFDFHIAPDPTLLLKNPFLFTTGRLIPPYVNPYPIPSTPTIGSFGFGLKGKGFDRLIATVQQEYSEAHVRLHIPFSPIMDPDGTLARDMRAECEKLISKPGVSLSLSHDFLSQEQLLDFLAQNTLNAFFYDAYPNRGLSSSTDYALAVHRPLALTRSEMFRHLRLAAPPIDIEQTSLREISANGNQPLEPFQREWTEENLAWDYERIVTKALALRPSRPWSRGPLRGKISRTLRRLAARSREDQPVLGPSAIWLQPSAENPNATLAAFAPKEKYHATVGGAEGRLNRILDDAARRQYASAVEELFRLSPQVMARKIPTANIQQAFVLDTVHTLAIAYDAPPRILCIGSYEDSAALSLKALGHTLDEIDPLLNYDLAEFIDRPSVRGTSYDLIFSTSVIEHVRDDEAFLKQIAALLSPGGTAVLTCDYLDQYKSGDPLPAPDFRFYTQRDFRERLLPLIPACTLVGLPAWDCEKPDFSYGGFTYTFATLVFRKQA